MVSDDEIKLPPLPLKTGYSFHSGREREGYTDMEMAAYARDAVRSALLALAQGQRTVYGPHEVPLGTMVINKNLLSPEQARHLAEGFGAKDIPDTPHCVYFPGATPQGQRDHSDLVRRIQNVLDLGVERFPTVTFKELLTEAADALSREERGPLTEQALWLNEDLVSTCAARGLTMNDFVIVVRAVERAHGIAAPGAKGAEPQASRKCPECGAETSVPRGGGVEECQACTWWAELPEPQAEPNQEGPKP